MTTPTNANALREQGEVGKTNCNQRGDHNALMDLFPESLPKPYLQVPPIVSGQCAQVLNLIRRHQPILSLTMTADHAIPEAAARVHDLRAMGWHIQTTIHSSVIFRGVERRNVASYSLGVPEWPAPGFIAGA